MAIVINGSGTVTGLAVGGLPDGTVDAGTLAANSVDSAELIDGAVDNSHMAAMAASKLSGTVAAARMPAGSVLQVVQATSTTYTHPNTSYADVSSSSIAITPSATSSKILYLYNSGGFIDDATQNCSLRLYRDSTVIVTNTRFGYMANTEHVPFPIHFMFLDSPNTTSAVTYKLQAQEAVSGQWEINDTSSSSVIVMEIAG